MVKITKIETILIDVPTIRPHVLSMATMNSQAVCLVFIHYSDGIIGIGEATTIGGLAYGPESPEGIKLAIDSYFAPLLQTVDGGRPAAAMSLISRHIVGNHFAKCAVETAMLDAQGKRTGMPVSELLGGRVRDRLPVLWTLASGNTALDIAEAEQMIETRRHNVFKLKIGKRPVEQDVAHVAEIKRALGDRASVRVDVNMAWDEPTAKRAAVMLHDAGCDLIEQPVSRNNRAGMARLSACSPIPIMADEALTGPVSAYDYASAAAATFEFWFGFVFEIFVVCHSRYTPKPRCHSSVSPFKAFVRRGYRSAVNNTLQAFRRPPGPKWPDRGRGLGTLPEAALPARRWRPTRTK